MMAVVDTRQAYHSLSDIFSPIGIGVFVLFTLLILGFVVRFRKRDDSPPSDVHEASKAEGAYVALLACVCAMLVYFTFHWMGQDLADLPGAPSDRGQTDVAVAQTPKPVQRVAVTASRWNWRFDYGGGATQVGTGTAIPTLVVPVGNVQLRLVSVDVIHSFFIPYMRFKRDAFPARPTNFTLGFTTGTVGFHHAWGECAQFCGLRHAYMQFNVRVLPLPAFRRWLARQRRPGAPQERTPIMNDQGRYS